MRLRALVTVLAAGIVLLSGCNFTGLLSNDPTPNLPTATQPPPKDSAALAKFYGQTLTWSACGALSCTEIKVPLNYDKPEGEQVTLRARLLKSGSSPKGVLLFNPGGPGASAIEYLSSGSPLVPRAVSDQFDVLAVDPRGVGQSQPISCVDGPTLDKFIGEDPTPDTAKEEAALEKSATDFANDCKKNGGPLLAHVDTRSVARDFDIVRAALRQPKLNYLGYSYGTFLGTTYAELFPDKVGRFVLDGVVPASISSDELNIGQAKGFEQATHAWARNCASQPQCPLGKTEYEVIDNLQSLLTDLDQNPPASTGDSSVPKLTEGWATLAIAVAMYNAQYWPILNRALDALVTEGNGEQLMTLADQYLSRENGGTYENNSSQVIYAVNCLDRPESIDIKGRKKLAADLQAVAPLWGRYMAWSTGPCSSWPVKGTDKPHVITAKGSDLIVLVGTTRDPATPYEWAEQVNRELDNSTLITFDGDGHTAYGHSNSCVDDAVNAYFLEGTPPEPGLRC